MSAVTISTPVVFGKEVAAFTIKIADMNIGISCAYALIEGICQEYLSSGDPLFRVQAEVTDKEKLKKFFLGFSEAFSEAYIESVAIYEKSVPPCLIMTPQYFMPPSFLLMGRA